MTKNSVSAKHLIGELKNNCLSFSAKYTSYHLFNDFNSYRTINYTKLIVMRYDKSIGSKPSLYIV